MAKYRYVQCSFWEDVDIVDNFSPEDKFFYLFLLTNPHTTQCGVYQISIKQMELETGYNRDTILTLIDRFENIHKKIKYNTETKEIALLNWFKYNDSTSLNTQKCIEKEFELVKDRLLIDFVRGLQGANKGHAYKKKKQKNKKNKEKETEFNYLWKMYPKKLGKDKAFSHYNNQCESANDMRIAIINYCNYIEQNNMDEKYIKHGSTFFNKDWKEFVEYSIEPKSKKWEYDEWKK